MSKHFLWRIGRKESYQIYRYDVIKVWGKGRKKRERRGGCPTERACSVKAKGRLFCIEGACSWSFLLALDIGLSFNRACKKICLERGNEKFCHSIQSWEMLRGKRKKKREKVDGGKFR